MGTIISAHEASALYGSAIFCDVVAGLGAEAVYKEAHVKGARWVDLETVLSARYSDAKDLGRHPLPSVKQFVKSLGALGISASDTVVLYDRSSGVMAAARMWWMLRSIGHHNTVVVDGGLEALEAAGLAIQSGDIPVESVEYRCERSHWQWPLLEMNEVLPAIEQGKVVVDVRGAARYAGKEEPIDPVAGHIPGAVNLPLTEVLEQGRFKSIALLTQHFESLKDQEVIMHCGSGVTACHSILAMVHAGYPVPTLYNGSWSQWCRNDLPMNLG
ncbi:MAG: hypothetical protein RL754_315 [Bacteroidota bacterium]